MDLSMVFLAAGMGSRYGGLKQMDGVGPNGETILDYSSFDALRAGFGRLVFVIREEMEADFRARIGDRIARDAAVTYAFQRDDDLPSGFTAPPGRTKPWGTGHAVLAAARAVDGPFAVANADDFYGSSSFAAVGAFLRDGIAGGVTPAATATYAMVGFRLGDTLSDRGPVSRGVCRTTPDRWLQEITETMGIEMADSRERHADAVAGDGAGVRDGGGRYRDATGRERTLPADTPVSMNLWAFGRDFFGHLRAGFAAFREGHALSPNAEFHLPACVQDVMRSGKARVAVLPTNDAWVGITHRDDRPQVAAHVAALIQKGVYPRTLWA
ncbi:MAG: nucleotidyltransferase [Phycisphaerales bacterium]|nr:nucleotidyltransferase [Phycisphaerales bacterium]